ncbi:MAG: ribosome biogenesis GTPase Der [Thermodesulfovibrionia bacterium]
MRIPIVAIIGRPNVGKSTLFNRIVGRRVAIIEDFPGVTRDRIYEEAEWDNKSFIIVDTGGFHPQPDEDITREIKRQALIAIEEADVVILMMDAETGPVPADIELINILRRYEKRVVYLVNKIDGINDEKRFLYDFYALGIELHPISALNGYRYEEFMDKLSTILPPALAKGEALYPRIAIVGRPNVGKSTLVNSLLGKDRMIVSPIPGTTRDAVDSICSYYKKRYVIVDTAGIRRKGKMVGTIERYSFMRTLKNIEASDVTLIMIDSTDGVVDMDQKIAGLVYKAGKGAIILLNKWDLVDKKGISIKAIEKEVYRRLWFMRYAPILTISAINKQRITKIFPLVDEIIDEANKRIGTHELNLFLRDVLSEKEPPSYHGKEVKIYYITQVMTAPPSFAIFTNIKEGVTMPYIRFIENRMRERFLFKGNPLRFYVKER